jgi:hypothetical protein
MTVAYISPKLKAPIRAAFRRHCHRFIATGYREAFYRIQNEPDEETDITGYICEALEEWFRKHPKQSVGFFIKDDPPLGGTGKTGKRRSRTDIIIGYAAGDRPEFFFEAKRLHRQKAVASRYTGVDGMGCFISGRYASRYTEAAMLGYVQTDTAERWQQELLQRVREEADKLKFESADTEVKFESAFPLEWCSIHRRDGHAPIKLFHLLVDCRKNVSLS